MTHYNIKESIAILLVTIFSIAVVSGLAFEMWHMIEAARLGLGGDDIGEFFLIGWVFFNIGAGIMIVGFAFIGDTEMFCRDPKYKRKLNRLKHREAEKKKRKIQKLEYENDKRQFFEYKNKVSGKSICIKCGEKLQDGAVFCSSCGEKTP